MVLIITYVKNILLKINNFIYRFMFNKEELKKICIRDENHLSEVISKNIKNYNYYKVFSDMSTDAFLPSKYLSVGLIIDNKFFQFKELSQVDILKYQDPKTTVFLKKSGEKFKLLSGTSVISSNLSTQAPRLNLEYLNITIKDYKISSKLLGLESVKKEYVGKVFTPDKYEILLGVSRKVNDDVCVIKVYDHSLERNITFSVADIEFEFPNLSGYSVSKDRTIKKGDVVKLKKDEFNNKWVVLTVNPDKTSKKISRNSNTRYKDLITIRREDNIIKTVYAKYLKKL